RMERLGWIKSPRGGSILREGQLIPIRHHETLDQQGELVKEPAWKSANNRHNRFGSCQKKRLTACKTVSLDLVIGTAVAAQDRKRRGGWRCFWVVKAAPGIACSPMANRNATLSGLGALLPTTPSPKAWLGSLLDANVA